MKKIPVFLFAFFVLSIISVSAQDTLNKKICKAAVHDFFLFGGYYTQVDHYASLTDFRTLSPQSDFLNHDFAEFDYSGGTTLTTNAGVNIMVGMKFRNKEKNAYRPNPLLRLGVSYCSGMGFSGNLYKSDRQTYDTLVSAQTGQSYYLDSVTTRMYNMNYYTQQLRVDGSVIFRTKPEARWSLFAGIGITAGVSLNARTDINYSIAKTTEIMFNGESTYVSGIIDPEAMYKTESIRNKTSIGGSVYIPMGVDFRIGKKKEFFKRTHLFYEMRPGLNFLSIPELHTIVGIGVQHGFGLRVSVD